MSKVSEAHLRAMNKIPLKHVAHNMSFTSANMQAALAFLKYDEKKVTEEVDFARAKQTGVVPGLPLSTAQLNALATILAPAPAPQ